MSIVLAHRLFHNGEVPIRNSSNGRQLYLLLDTFLSSNTIIRNHTLRSSLLAPFTDEIAGIFHAFCFTLSATETGCGEISAVIM